MNNLDSQTLTTLVIVAVLIMLALAAWLSHRRRQSLDLQQRFGSEYGRAIDAFGNRDKAEAELRSREKRVQGLHIVPLVPADAERFAAQWVALQARFVDSPKGTLQEADRLVREVMLRRGYPMGDFERRAADISVDHPAVVDHFRQAQAIAQRDRHDQADTEELRKAVVHYRALFDELLETQTPVDASGHRRIPPRTLETRP